MVWREKINRSNGVVASKFSFFVIRDSPHRPRMYRDVPSAELRAGAVAAARRALRIMAHAHLDAVAATTVNMGGFVRGAVDRLHLDGRIAEVYDAFCAGLQACVADEDYACALLYPLHALLTARAFAAARQRLSRIVADEIRAAHVRAATAAHVRAATAAAIVHPRPRRSSRVNFRL